VLALLDEYPDLCLGATSTDDLADLIMAANAKPDKEPVPEETEEEPDFEPQVGFRFPCFSMLLGLTRNLR
jgi:hypothetical protein